jgi:hypothetical protein
MLIRITQQRRKYWKRDFPDTVDKKLHLETHVVTTVWFLFLPIFKRQRLVSDNM